MAGVLPEIQNGGGMYDDPVRSVIAPRQQRVAEYTPQAILPSGLATDNGEAYNNKSSYRGEVNPSGDVRRQRLYASMVPTAGQAPPLDAGVSARISGQASPRRRPNDFKPGVDNASTLMMHTDVYAKPVPSQHIPTYNTLLDHAVPSQIHQGTTKRQAYEHAQHAKLNDNRQHKRPTPHGLHNDSKYAHDIVSNLDANGMSSQSSPLATHRKTANHSQYSYNIVSNDRINGRPERTLEAASPRSKRFAHAPGDREYNILNMTDTGGTTTAEGMWSPRRGMKSFAHQSSNPLDNIPKEPRRPRVAAHPATESGAPYNIVHNGPGGRAGGPDGPKNQYITDTRGHTMRHTKRQAPPDSWAGVKEGQRPEPSRRQKMGAGNDNVKQDSVWNALVQESPMHSKDNTNPRRGRQFAAVADHLWDSSDRRQAAIPAEKAHVSIPSSKPHDNVHFVFADNSRARTPPRAGRRAPQQSSNIIGTVFNDPKYR